MDNNRATQELNKRIKAKGFRKKIRKILEKVFPQPIVEKIAITVINSSHYFYNQRNAKEYYTAVTPLFNPATLKRKIEELDAKLGEAEKIFYRIISGASDVGLMSYINITVHYLLYAIAKGYIPVVDMQSFKTTYMDAENYGTENTWEVYFEQPYGFSLDDIGDSKCLMTPKVTFFENKKYKNNTYKSLGEVMDPAAFEIWSVVFTKYVRINQRSEQFVKQKMDAIINSGERVLGVFCRSADYGDKPLYGHFIQPKIKDVIEKVSMALREWNCDKIFLSTDLQQTLDLFKKEFPGKVVSVPRQYYDGKYTETLDTPKVNFARENDTYLRGMEYLAEMVILSRCTCVITGITGGTIPMLYMNNGKHENKYIFDLGRYGINSTPII